MVAASQAEALAVEHHAVVAVTAAVAAEPAAPDHEADNQQYSNLFGGILSKRFSCF